MLEKEKIKYLFAEAYKAAVYAEVNMGEITEILGNIHSFFLQEKDYDDIIKETDKYLGELLEKENQFGVIFAFKNRYQHLLAQTIKADVKRLFSENAEKGMEFWLQQVGKAIAKLRKDLYEPLLKEKFPVPPLYKENYKLLKKLTPFVTQESWAEAYPLFTHLAGLAALPDSVRATCWILAGQIQLYYLLNYDSALAHFEQAKQLDANIAQAERAFAEYFTVKKEYEKARQHIQHALDQGNQHYENFFFLGRIYKAENKYSIAERWFLDGLKINYGKAEFLNQLILLNESKPYFQENAQKIDDLLLKISKLDPDFAYTATNNAGFVYQNNVHFTKAEDYYNKAVSLHPERIQAYINLGYLFLDNNQLDRTFETFTFVTTRFPYSFEGYWGLVFYYRKIKEWQPTFALLKKCRKIRPDWDKYILRELGYGHEMLKDLKKAKTYYLEALKSDPDKEIALNDLYELIRLFSAANLQEALAILEKIRTIKGKSFDEKYYSELANLHHKQKNYDEAIQYFIKAIHTLQIPQSTQNANGTVNLTDEIKSAENKKATYYSDIVRVYKDSNRVEEAEKFFKKTVRQNPKDDLAWNNLGLLAYEHKDDEKAVEYYRKAIKIKPSTPVYHSNLGLSLGYLNRWEEAKEAFKQAAELDSEYSEYWYSLGRCYQSLKQKEEAAANYHKALDLDASNDLAWNGLGLLAYERKDDEKAVEYYQKAIEIKPNHPVYYSNLGLSLGYLSQWEDAIKAFKKAIELDSGNALYWNNLGQVYRDANRLDEAEKAYQDALRLEKNNPVYLNNIAIVYAKQGNYQKAIQYYKNAIALDPTNDLQYENLALTYRWAQNWQEAEDAYKKAVELNPNNDLAWNGLGLLAYERKNDEKAVEYYRRAIKINPNDPVYYFNLGLSLMVLYKIEASQKAFEQAIALNASHDLAWNGLGLLAYEQQKDEQAIGYYQKAIAINPDNAVYHSNLGLSLGYLDRWEEAHEAYELAHHLDPENTLYVQQLQMAQEKLKGNDLAY